MFTRIKMPEKVELANKMLNFLRDRNLLEGKNPRIDVLDPFCAAEGVEPFEAYKAWELLYYAGRRLKSQGGYNWKLTSFSAIALTPAGVESFELRLKNLEKRIDRIEHGLLVLAKYLFPPTITTEIRDGAHIITQEIKKEV